MLGGVRGQDRKKNLKTRPVYPSRRRCLQLGSAHGRKNRDQQGRDIDGGCNNQGNGRRSGDRGGLVGDAGSEPTRSGDGQLVGERGGCAMGITCVRGSRREQAVRAH